MAAQWRRFATFVVVFLTLHSAFSADLLKSSPSPAPEVGAYEKISSPPTKSLASTLDNNSPPAPPPSTKSSRSPSPSPASDTSPSPSPSPPPAADSKEASPSPAPSEKFRATDAVASDTPEKKSGGMNAGKKVGIALGGVVGVGVVVVAGIIYKKRQDNIQRSQYGYATRIGLI